MIELWKDINEYEGLYQISNFGRVKSLTRLIKNGNKTFRTQNEYIRKNQTNHNRNGYIEISLFKDSIEKRYKLHRLVANAFIDNIDNKPEVNHIDGNKSNNNVSNLEWVTDLENKQHAWQNNLCTSKHRTKEIVCIDTGEIFESVVDCSRKLGIDRSFIFKMLKGKRNSCKGLKFAYRGDVNE